MGLFIFQVVLVTYLVVSAIITGTMIYYHLRTKTGIKELSRFTREEKISKTGALLLIGIINFGVWPYLTFSALRGDKDA